MAVPLRVRNIPEYLRAPQLLNQDVPSKQFVNESEEFLQFPKSTCVLWDGTSTGHPAFLHVAHNRKPKLQITEKVLWLISKQTEHEGTANKILVGSLSVDDDAEGVCFHIDGLDTRQADSDSSLALGDVMIPVQVSNSRNQDRTGSAEDYTGAIKMLQKRCRGRDPVDLNSLLLVKGWCSFYSHQGSEKTVAHLQFDLVTLATVFKATPVNPVPIVPTALAKNLGGPRSLSQMQGRPKIGYLTMDHTRKLLLVLESDPKVSSLPIVGIWISGVSLVQHPFVWASCLRYLQSEQLGDRVCVPPEGFLLVVYSPLHSRPEFYEVTTTSGKSDPEFDLYTGYEITSLNKKSSSPEASVVEWELSPVRNGPKRELFDAALEGLKSNDSDNSKGSRNTPSPALSASEDIMPRMTPAPHASKAMSVKPMVPEVSMFWNDSSPSPAFGPTPFSSAPSHMPCPYSAASAASLPSAPASNRVGSGAPVPSSISSSVPLSSTSYPAAACFTSCGQESECMPRGAVRCVTSAQNQNNSARTPISGAPTPSGLQGATFRTGVPQLYSSTSQPVNQFNGSSYPSSIPQGPALQQYAPSQPRMMLNPMTQGNIQPHSQPRQPQPQFHHPQPSQFPQSQPPQYPQPTHFSQNNPSRYPQTQPFSQTPQPHSQLPQPSSQPPQPRLMPPAAMHMCRPNQPRVEASTPGINPLQGVQQPQAGQLQARPLFPVPSHTQVRQAKPWSHQPLQVQHPSVPNCISGHQSRPEAPYLKSPAVYSHQQTGSCMIQKQCDPHNGSNPQHLQNPTDLFKDHRLVQPNVLNSLPNYAQESQREIHALQNSVTASQPSASKLSMLTIQAGDSTHADSTSCSGKSSDDSGLSVTPDHSDPLAKSSSFPGAGVEGSTGGSLQGVNWAGVPPEVVQLLVQQDAQLKVLSAQIQQLLSQQGSLSSPTGSDVTTPTPFSINSTPATLKKEMCSTAVNTTLLPLDSQWGRQNVAQCASVQTSPQKPASPYSNGIHAQSPLAAAAQHSPQSSLPSLGPQRHFSPPGSDGTTERQQQRIYAAQKAENNTNTLQTSHDIRRHFDESYRNESMNAGQTPSEIRHQGVVQLSSTQREDGGSAVGSFHSNASLEHASPCRSMECQVQNVHSTPSPQSASMCGPQKHEENEDSGKDISPDSKEYYDQLISNIRLFLNSHSQDTENINSDANHGQNVSEEPTCTQLHLLESNFAASPSLPVCPSGGGSSNTTMIPHINYLSLMLSSESESSIEMNAMAMKYLQDEQLTQLARINQSPKLKASGNQLLRQVLAASLDGTGASDISRLGLSATNMSMATRKYMEKHGLLGGGEGESVLDADHTLRLQTDFSIAVSSEAKDSHHLPTSPQKAAASPHHASPHPNGTRSPLKREFLHPAFNPSPVITEEKENSSEDWKGRGMEDLGASPALPPSSDRRRYYRDPSPEDTPLFPERYRGAHGQNLLNDCSVDTSDDRILDIEKLKQMPKLL